MCLLKNTARPAKRDMYKEPIRLQDSLPCPLKKKKKKEQENNEIHNINTTIWEHFCWYFLNEMNKGKPDFNLFKVFHIHDTMKN